MFDGHWTRQAIVRCTRLKARPHSVPGLQPFVYTRNVPVYPPQQVQCPSRSRPHPRLSLHEPPTAPTGRQLPAPAGGSRFNPANDHVRGRSGAVAPCPLKRTCRRGRPRPSPNIGDEFMSNDVVFHGHPSDNRVRGFASFKAVYGPKCGQRSLNRSPHFGSGEPARRSLSPSPRRSRCRGRIDSGLVSPAGGN